MIQLSERRLFFQSLFSLPARRFFLKNFWRFCIAGMILSVVCSLIAYPVTSSLLRARIHTQENRGQRLKYHGRWHLLQTR
jgi:hypothetical protein